MTRRPPTSSPTPWSATKFTTLASWRTFVWGGQDTPSARPMSLVSNATKCSANQPGPTGGGLPGNAAIYPESAANCLAAQRDCERDFISGQVQKHFVRKDKCGHRGRLSSVFNWSSEPQNAPRGVAGPCTNKLQSKWSAPRCDGMNVKQVVGVEKGWNRL